MKLKRWIALILAALMLLSVAPAMAVSNDSQKDTGSCPSEDAKNRNNGQHHYIADVSDPWCETTGTVWWVCIYCGETQTETIPALGHDFHDDWHVVKEPTCTETGERVRYCHRCQKEDRQTTPALGHKFGKWKTDEAPTCTEKGLEYRTCERCGIQEWRYTDPLGHLWDEGVVTREPTPEKDGEITYTCQRDPSHKYYEPIPYQGGPTTPPDPTLFPVSLDLELEKVGPDKASYQLNDQVEYKITMTNTGSLDMPDPVLDYTYLYSEGQKVNWITSSMLGVSVLHVNESVSYNVFVPINERAVEIGSQVITSQGHATIPAGASLTDEQLAERFTDDKLWTVQLGDEVPVDKSEFALEFSVVQTSPVKPVYSLGETVEFDVTIKNASTVSMYMLHTQRTNHYTHYVEELFYRTGAYIDDEEFLPGEGFTAHCSYVIQPEDVERTEVTLSFTGGGWCKASPNPNTESDQYKNVDHVLITLPTTNAEYALELTAWMTNPIKAAYQEFDPVWWSGTLKNISDEPVTVPLVESYWVEGGYSMATDSESITLAPDESYSFSHSSDFIIDDDVTNGQLTLKLSGSAKKVSDDSPVISNDVTLVWPTTDEPSEPTPGNYAIELNVWPKSPKAQYEVDGYGNTEPISYSAVVTNIGEEPFDFSEVWVYIGGGASNFPHYEPTQRLYPNDSYSFSIDNVILSDLDINIPSSDPDVLGDVTMEFFAVGFYPDTDMDACTDSDSLQHTLVEPEPWHPDPETSIHVDKVETSYHVNPNGYMLNDVITYEIYVTNTGYKPIPQVDVYDVLEYHGDTYVTTLYDLQPAETRTVPFQHTVDSDDVARTYVINWAYAEWVEPDPDNPIDRWADSDDVISPTTDTELEGGLVITKAVVPGPANGAYYIPGEIIEFSVTVTNTMDVPLENVEVYDPLAYDYPFGMIGNYPTLAPHESKTIPVYYEAQEWDVDHVTNVAWGMGWCEAVQEIKYGTSEEVTVPVHKDPPKNAALLITKEETSVPVFGYYELNDTITYLITVENVGEAVLYDVAIYDTLEPGMNEIAHVGILHPGEKQSVAYSYTVTEDDVPDKATCVVNYAIADYWPEGDNTYYSVFAGPVISPTSTQPVPPPTIKKKGDDDSCKLTLKGLGSFTYTAEQHYCSTHKAVNDQVDQLLSQGAYQQAKDAWLKALNEEYESTMKQASGLAKAAIMEDQRTFNLYLESYEALVAAIYPSDPGAQAKAVCELLMDQTSELCYLSHNPGKVRPDSMFTGKYVMAESDAAASKCLRSAVVTRTGETMLDRVLCTDHGAIQTAVINMVKQTSTAAAAEDTFRRVRRLWQSTLDKDTNLHYRSADAATRQIIGKNRTLFDQLLEKREALLKEFYPKNPEIVVEVLSNMVRNQVLTLCQLW